MRSKIEAKEFDQERRKKISDMADIGVKQIDIVDYYGMPKNAVSKIIRRGRIQKQEEARVRRKILLPKDLRNLLKSTCKLRFKPES